jgi:hypothetical protein
MRKDMGKVVIERPRTGGMLSYKDIRRSKASQEFKKIKISDVSGIDDVLTEDEEIQLETLPKGGIEKMKQSYGWETKEFSDLLGPIKRYLHSKVGENWDDVWSEVCQTLKGNHPVEHVREHVEDMVDLRKEAVRKYYTWANFYVDENNILKRTEPRIKNKKQLINIDGIMFVKEKEDKFWELSSFYNDRISTKDKQNYNIKIFFDEGNEYALIKNNWYKFEYKNIKDMNIDIKELSNDDFLRSIKLYDHYLLNGIKTTLTGVDLIKRVNQKRKETNFQRIRVNKLQLSHKELKKLNLIENQTEENEEKQSFSMK